MTEEQTDYKVKIDEANHSLTEELGEWEKLGVDPAQIIAFNPFWMDSWVKALTKFLVKNNIIIEDEFIFFMKEEQLKSLQELRADVEIKVRQAKMESLGVTLPHMEIPGTKRKIH